MITKIKYRDWEFELDKELTISTYQKVISGGADSCECTVCKNYVAYRENVFPAEIRQLLIDLGIDYRKEVEIISYDDLADGLYLIEGWFHFKGRILSGKDCCVSSPNGNGFSLDLTEIDNNFSIGFTKRVSLTHFMDETNLVQVDFETRIPCVLDNLLEVE